MTQSLEFDLFPTSLAHTEPLAENPDYLSRQLITYIGNKRALLGSIALAVEKVKKRMDKPKLRVLDAFSGSGVVSRFFKAHATTLTSNDIEEYAAVTGRCYLQNASQVDSRALCQAVSDLNAKVETEDLPIGFIEELYSPQDESKIQKEDRVFYTKKNARRLDNYRRLIDDFPAELQDSLLGPLIGLASVHANTAGVFKGFYKNRATGIGQFGGTGRDALTRIMGDITLEVPILSNFDCDCQVLQEDANVVVRKLSNLDLVYVDPPYNQHPYGSNYFMLNLIAKYGRPHQISRVSGIPTDWQRSGFNVKTKSLPLLHQLLVDADAPFLLISFSNEGFIQKEEMNSLLQTIGSVEVLEKRYNAFRGSRNFNNRPLHVTELLYLVERK